MRTLYGIDICRQISKTVATQLLTSAHKKKKKPIFFLTMNTKSSRWIRLTASAVLAFSAAGTCACAATDYDQVGKQTSILLQNFHFSRQEFSDKMSERFLNTYLDRQDPSKIFLTQEDVDRLKASYGKKLDDYLMGGNMMEAAAPLHNFYKKRALQRLDYARELIKKEKFTFDSNKKIERSRSKLKVWPKDEAAMKQVWRDMVEEQLLAEHLRRETITKLAKEQNKPNPLANEKPAKEKLLMRYERIKHNIEETDQEDVAEALLSAVSLTYDPHTDYMGARKMEQFMSQMDAGLVGIGALLAAEDDGSTKITGIVVGGPAEKSGELKLNDRIVGIDKNNTGEMVDILFMKLDKVVDMIRGTEGTTIRMKVESADNPGQAKIITIVRAQVPMKDELAKGEIIEINGAPKEKNRIGVLTLPAFYADMNGGDRRCATDVQRILERMAKENVNGLVIDLRNNGGGSLEEVRRMTGFFTGRGPVVQIKDTRGEVEVKSAYNREKLFKGPIVVLINKLSASASEILAAALQDYGRAVIVGDTSSFGKGTVQQPVEVGRFLPYFADRDRAGSLKVTTQKFYRVAGGSTQLKGVESDIVLPTSSAAYEIGESTLDFAMPYDQIPACTNYTKNPAMAAMLPALKKASAERVAKDKDMQTTAQEIERVKKRIKENKISLNKEERVKESEEFQNRRKEVNKDRKTRFAEMAKSDAAKYKIYRLTLDDVDAEKLPLADPEKDNEQFMKMAEDPTEQLDDSPEYPSGLDPELREGINIVQDMLNMAGAKKK